MSKNNGASRPSKGKVAPWLSKAEIAAAMGIPEFSVTKDVVLVAARFAAAMDNIVSTVFTEQWVVDYAQNGLKKMPVIPFNGLTAESIWSELYSREVVPGAGEDENGTLIPDLLGISFNEGFMAAIYAMSKFYETKGFLNDNGN